MKCVVNGCENREGDGEFACCLCKPCYNILITGKVAPSHAWLVRAIEGAKEEVLKDVTVTSKTNGEVVAVTLTDEDHRIYKVLWERNKK